MSEQDDRAVLDLIDRAATHAPPLSLDRQDVVARGRQIRRRRRAGVAGVAVVTLALAGTVWLGGEGLVGAPHEAQPAASEATVQPTPQEPVGEGGTVTLLGEDYEVAEDAYGWPQLLEADGSVFLTVSDPDGPPPGSGGGGSVMWREHWWWPWSDHHEVRFSYTHGDRPDREPVVDGQDAVTITGPAGEVSVTAVPAGS